MSEASTLSVLKYLYDHPIKIYCFNGLPFKERKKYIGYIYRVLEKIPDESREKICKNCAVYVVDNFFGLHLNKSDKEIIILNWFQMLFERVPRKEILFTVAHEFAHSVLKHRELTKGMQKVLGIDQEKEADDLALEWGFSKPDRKINGS